MYNPDNQYRCTIIRGKSQTNMEDLLPFYAQMIHRFCPCTKGEFEIRCNTQLSQFLFNNSGYSILPIGPKKTISNHRTEIMGMLLGLYFTTVEDMVYESSSCKFLLAHHDFPTFFKNICFNFQFPNCSQKINTVKERMDNKINISSKDLENKNQSELFDKIYDDVISREIYIDNIVVSIDFLKLL